MDSFKKGQTYNEVLLHKSNPLLQNTAHLACNRILIRRTNVDVVYWKNTSFFGGNIGTTKPLGVILFENSQRVTQGDGDLVRSVWNEVGDAYNRRNFVGLECIIYKFLKKMKSLMCLNGLEPRKSRIRLRGAKRHARTNTVGLVDLPTHGEKYKDNEASMWGLRSVLNYLVAMHRAKQTTFFRGGRRHVHLVPNINIKNCKQRRKIHFFVQDWSQLHSPSSEGPSKFFIRHLHRHLMQREDLRRARTMMILQGLV